MEGRVQARTALGLAAIAATLAAYGAGAAEDGLFDPARRAERAFIAQYLAENALGPSFAHGRPRPAVAGRRGGR